MLCPSVPRVEQEDLNIANSHVVDVDDKTDIPPEILRRLIIEGVTSADPIVRNWCIDQLLHEKTTRADLQLILMNHMRLSLKGCPPPDFVQHPAFPKYSTCPRWYPHGRVYAEVAERLASQGSTLLLFWIIDGLDAMDEGIRLQAANYIESLILPNAKRMTIEQTDSLGMIVQHTDGPPAPALGLPTTTPISYFRREGMRDNAYEIWTAWLQSASESEIKTLADLAKQRMENVGHLGKRRDK